MKKYLTFENLPVAVSLLCEKVDNIEILLLNQKALSEEEPDEILTVKGAADFLNLSEPTIYSKNSRGELPSCKPHGGKRLYFSKKSLVEYVKSGRKKTNEEIAKEAQIYLNK